MKKTHHSEYVLLGVSILFAIFLFSKPSFTGNVTNSVVSSQSNFTTITVVAALVAFFVLVFLINKK